VDPSLAPELSAAPGLPLVILYQQRPEARRAGHEGETLRELARQIAELKGTQVAGEFRDAQAYPANRYLIPDDTLTLAQAHKLGVRSVHDLYGGVVPFPFVATKLIAHSVPDAASAAPPGWSRALGARTASLVLPGYAAFSRDDARSAARALWDGGRVRVKRPYGIGGAGQALIKNEGELEAQLDALGDEALQRDGISIERHLEALDTFSVGQVTLDDLVVSYYGVQHLTRNNHGHDVYGGSDLVVVRGGFDVLERLDLAADLRECIAKARAFDAAVQIDYAGFFASRRNYDVACGVDAASVRHCGVLEQSWRVGGATGAEIGALRTFRANPDACVVRASTREVYGENVHVPDGACLVYRGTDSQAGPITKFYTLNSDTVQRSSDS